LKSKNTKTEPISKKATRNPKAADAGPEKEVKSIKSRGEGAAARRNEKVAATAGQKRIQGYQAASSRRSQGKRDIKTAEAQADH
jgi:hypothetical protein